MANKTDLRVYKPKQMTFMIRKQERAQRMNDSHFMKPIPIVNIGPKKDKKKVKVTPVKGKKKAEGKKGNKKDKEKKGKKEKKVGKDKKKKGDKKNKDGKDKAPKKNKRRKKKKEKKKKQKKPKARVSGFTYVPAVNPKEPCVQRALLHDLYEHWIRDRSETSIAEEQRKLVTEKVDAIRLGRASCIRSQHKMFMKIAAFYMQVPYQKIEDGVIDDDLHCELMNQFIAENGLFFLFFSWKLKSFEVYNLNDDLLRMVIEKRIVVCNGLDSEFEDYVVFMYRIRNNFAAEPKNIFEEYYFGGFKYNEKGTYLADAFARLWQDVIGKSVNIAQNFGESIKTSLIPGNWRFRFNHDVDYLGRFLKNLEGDLSSRMDFVYSDDFYKDHLMTDEQRKATVDDFKTFDDAEATFLKWRSDINHALYVLNKSKDERGVVTPLTELEYWRHVALEFGCMAAFFDTQVCIDFVDCMKQAKNRNRSNAIDGWNDLVDHIKTIRTEAADNALNFREIERFWEHFQYMTPMQVIPYVPCAILAFRTLRNLTSFYNTSEKASIYLFKVTNAVLGTCRRFITDNYAKPVWFQQISRVKNKTNDCVYLGRRYKQIYKKIRSHMKHAFDDGEFGVESSYLFGKLKSFKQRMIKILSFMTIMRKYSVLHICTVEGLAPFDTQYQAIFKRISNQKTYDPLDDRDTKFDEEFKWAIENMEKLNNELRDFMLKCLCNEPNMDSLLLTLKRFERMKLGCLRLPIAYATLFDLLYYETEELRDFYNEDRKEPLIVPHVPPVAGHIFWIRNYSKSIEEPMQLLQSRLPSLHHLPDSQNTIKKYNGLLAAFTYYELLKVDTFLRHYKWVNELLNRTVLRRIIREKKDAADFDAGINFTPTIRTILLETDFACRLDSVHLSEEGLILVHSQYDIFKAFQILEALLKRIRLIETLIPNVFTNLMVLILGDLTLRFRRCYKSVLWKSWGTLGLLNKIDKKITFVEDFIKEVKDFRETRIDRELSDLQKLNYLYFHPVPVNIEEFLKRNLYYQMKVLKELKTKSYSLDMALRALINKFVKLSKSKNVDKFVKFDWLNVRYVDMSLTLKLKEMKERDPFEYSTSEDEEETVIEKKRALPMNTRDLIYESIFVYNYYHRKRSDAILKCIKDALVSIKHGIMGTRGDEEVTRKKKKPKNTFLLAEVFLEIPDIKVTPMIEDMQNVINKIVIGILNFARDVIPWGLPEDQYAPAECDDLQMQKDFSKLSSKLFAETGEGAGAAPKEEERKPCEEVKLEIEEEIRRQLEEKRLAEERRKIEEEAERVKQLAKAQKQMEKKLKMEESRKRGSMTGYLDEESEEEGEDAEIKMEEEEKREEVKEKVAIAGEEEEEEYEEEEESEEEVEDLGWMDIDVDTMNFSFPDFEEVTRPVYDHEGRQVRKYYPEVLSQKYIQKLIFQLQNVFQFTQEDIQEALKPWLEYSFVWGDDRDQKIQEFVDEKTNTMLIREKFSEYINLAQEVGEFPASVPAPPLELSLVRFNETALEEAKKWKLILGSKLREHYHRNSHELLKILENRILRLNQPIETLDDVRNAMACLEEIRENFIVMDLAISKVEDVFDILTYFEIDVDEETSEFCYGLRGYYDRMNKMAIAVQEDLCEKEEPMRIELVAGVRRFPYDLETFNIDFEESGPLVEGIPPKEASDRLMMFQERFDELFRLYELYRNGEKLFGIPVTDFPTVPERKKQLNLLQKLYGLYVIVMKAIDNYYERVWQDIDIEAIMGELNDYQNRCRMLPKGMKEWPAYSELKQKIDDFSECCPLLELMANKSMKERHWKRLEDLLGVILEVESPNFKLKDIMAAPLLKNKDDVEDICVGAVKEKDIEFKLRQVQAEWANVLLEFSTFKNKGELLIKGVEALEIISALEDSLMILGSLLSNRYNVFYKKEIQQWVYNVSTTSSVLEKWLLVQNLWMYLEAVFVGGDIAKQMPTETKRFASIDKTWQKIMTRAREIVKVIPVCVGDDSMKTILPYLLEQLETCQKSLVWYLEKKRLIFPRFFFVSDPALLDILGQASDPHTIQAHLLAVFENIAKVEFDKRQKDLILAIISREGERIELDHPVRAFGGVENWLGALLVNSKNSLGSVISSVWDFLHDPEFRILKMTDNFPSQVGLLGLQMLWTRECEKAMNDSSWNPNSMRKTNVYFLRVLNVLIDMTTRDLGKFERVRYETLVTIHVHQRDIFDDIYKMSVTNTHDFEWLKQERFYFNEETDMCNVSITNVKFVYQNEFLGCSDRLVITPLTDRCYITLAQAIGMAMGGAPAGPAGTGKTETVKDMGKSLGKYVVVFNCSDQMDFRGLGRIFKGLAQSGSWGCFDEFNRIELPVLSVAAQQISIVLYARKDNKSFFIFSDGDKVLLDYEFGIFLTMNPGYAGRQELPENLKIMFRSVAMMVPDRQIIIRVKMASCGFRENIILSRKFYVLYELCEEQLSKQVHYDFGLRNILSVLRTLGAQRRANAKESEDTTLMRVLRDMNVSKLVDEDEPLFLSLIEDLFVGLKLTTSTYKDLQKAIQETCEAKIFTNFANWNLKIIQLYETSLVRHGLMTMGPTGAGKTSCIHVLMSAMSKCGRPHSEMRMNPKAITAPQMFGRLDVATNDWTDGIFSTLWRRSLKTGGDDHIWIVLDGPVDAVWIENLNSVLDDNKTLTLANGDRIVMAANSKLVFEPDNVDNASPATVSRMGMVFLSSSVLPWRPILEAWLKKKPNEAETFSELFDAIYSDAFFYLETRLKTKMRILEALYIRQCVDLLDGLLMPEKKPESDTDILGKSQYIVESRVFTPRHLERLFLFAVMWSLGSVLELKEREKLEAFMLKHPSKLAWPFKLDETDTIFEYLVDDNGEWTHWNTQVEEYIYPSNEVPEFATILVPNVDNVRTTFLIDLIAKQGKGVLLTGEQGTAKTVMLKGYMSRYDPEFHLNKSLNFSSATTPNMFQRIMESYVEKRSGTTYGPPNNRKMTIFVDDINMPVINEWGDQVTNEIVRQLMEMVGFYSLDKPGEFLNVIDLQFVAAMIHPGGGRNDIPPRLKRRFNIFNCTLPSEKSMDKIFSVLGQGYFCSSRFKADVVEFVPKLVPLTRYIWQRTKVKMLPTPAKFHYVFNLRDLSRIWEGMLHIEDPQVNGIITMLKLWKHECTRVIADRFTEEADKDWFEKNMTHCVTRSLEKEELLAYTAEHTYFVDFLRDPPEPTGDEPEDFVLEAPKIYEEIYSWEFLIDKLQQYMSGYNEVIRGSPMDLVFFHDAMVHLMVISRIIRTPRGSAMLVGVGGSGKQSVTKLATFIANYRTHQITLTRSYNVGNFMDDLKLLYRTAGADCLGISFIFTDNDVKDEAFLEFLNNILSAGEVANLFAKDELDEILNTLTPKMRKKWSKKPPTLDNLYGFFISESRNNLHVVLCFSPVSEKFRSRALKFPGLISGCTMDWFSRWPKDALIAVSQHFLIDYPIVCSPRVKNELIILMGEVQDFVADICNDYFERFRRRTYVTPKSFLSFLEGYKSIYLMKHEEIKLLTHQMSTGLQKLTEASASVDLLRQELEVTKEEITIANEKAEEVLAEVTVMATAAEQVQAEVKEVATKATALVETIAADKEVALSKLEEAKPALLAAEAALLTIRPADIATVRKLGRPPHLITVIMDAVIVLFQRKLLRVRPDMEKDFLKPNWGEALKMMTDTRFLFHLQHFPKDRITAEIVDLLQPYFRFEKYNFQAAKQACGNVAGLLQWTIAMAQFYAVNREILPLKTNLALQEAKLGEAQKELEAAEALLRAKEEELAQTQATFYNAMREKEEVQEIADRCQAKMDAATALIDGLSGEKIRWTEQLEGFKSETMRLVGDVLLLTGFLSYAGPFNQEYRIMLNTNWFQNLRDRKIPISNKVDLVENLADTATIGEWNLQGLPNDELSIQNGIIVTKASRFPLLIDPQSQGVSWIKNKEKELLQVTVLSHKYFRQHVEDSISLGKPLLIEDVLEELDPVLDNVLEKNYIKIGTTMKVKLGDKEVDVHKDFRMYITTKLANPSYTPEISARTSIIDFTVTVKGLEDQLLGRVILTEKKELEVERTTLIADVTKMKRSMKELEANLLTKLTSVKGSLVDDETVIVVLNTTKDTAATVRQKLATAAQTEIKITFSREQYRPVASRGSVLYFLIVEMSLVNCMYQTSLVQFLERFDFSLENSEKSALTAQRIVAIINYLTFEVFKYKARGLYEEHKYLFTLLLTLKVDLQRVKITHQEFHNFIKGGAALDLNAVPPKPTAKWITDSTWLNLVALSALPEFKFLLSQVSANEKEWKVWFEKEMPEEEIFPEDYESLPLFKKILLIRAMCPDRIMSQSYKYIGASLGEQYTIPVVLDINALLEESRPLTPMICFLSMGSDPTPLIEQTAKKLNVEYSAISMGQGQEIHARKLIDASMKEGGWVLLQNCHLGTDYMCELFIVLTEETNPHSGFRLWMTTEPNLKFPINLLQICLKFTNEPPQGIRAGLTGTYSTIGQDMLDYSNHFQYRSLVFGISFLHTVVQERRKFGPLGWNIPYEFNFADWYASCLFVQHHIDHIERDQSVDWTTLRYMISEVQYGGRVTDDFDKRLLSCITRVWFNPFLMDPAFRFFTGYRVMVFKERKEYLAAIYGMALNDPPEAFGLHPNANITYQTNTITTVLDTILTIQPKESGGGTGETREDVVSRQAKDFLKKLPKDFDPHFVKERLFKMGHLNSLNIFLRQEIDRMRRVLILVRITLRDLLMAIEGTIIMNETLRDALDNIYDAKVPNLWLRGSWESNTIGFWFTELIERCKQFNAWITHGRPVQFWMTGFFNPQGFLTAMRQEVARAHPGWALDSVSLNNTVTKLMKEQVRVPPTEGIFIYGLFLEGGSWDRRTDLLTECIPKVLFAPCPVIHAYAINSTDPKDSSLYPCPIYKRTRRTGLNFVTLFWLPCKLTPDHWIMRGTALLCDTQ